MDNLQDRDLTDTFCTDSLPVLQAKAESLLVDMEKATAASLEAKDRVDLTVSRGKLHGARCIELNAQITQMDTEIREEAWSLGESFDAAGHSQLRRAKTDQHEMHRSLQDYFSTFRHDEDMDAYLVATEAQANCELAALSAAELLQRARTASLMGPILACEGGSASIGGARSAQLREAVVAATQRVNSASNALAEFRRNAANRRIAWQSRGGYSLPLTCAMHFKSLSRNEQDTKHMTMIEELKSRSRSIVLQRFQVRRQVSPAVEAKIMGDLFEGRITDEVPAATGLQVQEDTQLGRGDMPHEFAHDDRHRHKALRAGVEHQFARLRKMLFAEPQVPRFLGLIALRRCFVCCRHVLVLSLSKPSVRLARRALNSPPLCGHGQSIH